MHCHGNTADQRISDQKTFMTQEFWVKRYLKPGHARSFSMNVALTVFMKIWKVEQKIILIPDTTGVH